MYILYIKFCVYSTSYSMKVRRMYLFAKLDSTVQYICTVPVLYCSSFQMRALSLGFYILIWSAYRLLSFFPRGLWSICTYVGFRTKNTLLHYCTFHHRTSTTSSWKALVRWVNTLRYVGDSNWRHHTCCVRSREQLSCHLELERAVMVKYWWHDGVLVIIGHRLTVYEEPASGVLSRQ
jgi:hypothetical protein